MSHALDTCTESQRRFRAVLALLLFNAHGYAQFAAANLRHLGPEWWQLARWDLDWSCAAEIRYSALHDELVVLCHAPQYLAAATLACPYAVTPRGIPGLRPLKAHPDGLWFRFRHVPTRALLRVELANPSALESSVPGYVPVSWEIATRSWDLHNCEEQAVRAVPPIHADAERLLGALLIRLTVREPAKRWSVGQLMREGRKHGFPPGRYLWGHGRHWSLHGIAPSAVVGLAAALTDPVIGLTHAVVLEREDRSILIGCREATLRLSASVSEGQGPADIVRHHVSSERGRVQRT